MVGRLLLRMSRFARRPPSPRRLAIWLVVIGLCLAIAGAQKLGLWPDWMTAAPIRRLR